MKNNSEERLMLHILNLASSRKSRTAAIVVKDDRHKELWFTNKATVLQAQATDTYFLWSSGGRGIHGTEDHDAFAEVLTRIKLARQSHWNVADKRKWWETGAGRREVGGAATAQGSLAATVSARREAACSAGTLRYC